MGELHGGLEAVGEGGAAAAGEAGEAALRLDEGAGGGQEQFRAFAPEGDEGHVVAAGVGLGEEEFDGALGLAQAGHGGGAGGVDGEDEEAVGGLLVALHADVFGADVDEVSPRGRGPAEGLPGGGGAEGGDEVDLRGAVELAGAGGQGAAAAVALAGGAGAGGAGLRPGCPAGGEAGENVGGQGGADGFEEDLLGQGQLAGGVAVAGLLVGGLLGWGRGFLGLGSKIVIISKTYASISEPPRVRGRSQRR